MPTESPPSERAVRLDRQLADALDTLEAARPLAKALHQNQVCTLALRLLKEPGGVEVLYRHAPRFDRAGVFHGGDWDHPTALEPSFVTASLHARGSALAIEALSELRFLAIAQGLASHPKVTPQYAREFLEHVLGHNIDLLFPEASEASRHEAGPLTDAAHHLFRFCAERLGYRGILAGIVEETERTLNERSILVGRVKEMIRIAGRTLAVEAGAELHQRTRRLVDAIEGPTELSRSAATAAEYDRQLRSLDPEALGREAGALGDTIWVTGLVCERHATLLRFITASHPHLLPKALGLGSVGRAGLQYHGRLVERLIEVAVHPQTAQCIYGLANMLESGVLFFPPAPRELRRLIGLRIHPEVAALLHESVEGGDDLWPNAILLAGIMSVLGQPLGIGQGDNPTCQSARAISLWAQVDAGYLLDGIAQAARDNQLVMHFEGRPIVSSAVGPGMAEELHTELDPVSLVLVPHLDRIYAEMSRLVVGRGEDGHRWINPEFHGWWVDRGFATTIDFATGAVSGFDAFIRLFYATHHPLYRGEAELTYPQPAGIAATDLWGGYLGWHAISIQRIAADPSGLVRVYFYNPNNDKRQRWGQGIETSTSGHGEWFGESSLPFHEFASRLYLFHYNEREHGPPEAVPAEEVQQVRQMASESWASEMQWLD